MKSVPPVVRAYGAFVVWVVPALLAWRTMARDGLPPLNRIVEERGEESVRIFGFKPVLLVNAENTFTAGWSKLGCLVLALGVVELAAWKYPRLRFTGLMMIAFAVVYYVLTGAFSMAWSFAFLGGGAD